MTENTIDRGTVYVHVGKKLRELRTMRGMKQNEVAELIGVSPQQYHKYEDAKSKCSLTVLFQLADHYEVPISSIIPFGSEEKQRLDVSVSTETDLLARLVTAYIKLPSEGEKLRLVQLVEAMQTQRAEGSS